MIFICLRVDAIKTIKRYWQHKISFKIEIKFVAWFSLLASASGELEGDVLRRMVRIRTAPVLIGWEDVVPEVVPAGGSSPKCL